MVLVPDLESYESSARRRGPVWTTASISRVEVTRSFFEIRDRQARTDFGIGGATLREHAPVLYFDVESARISSTRSCPTSCR